MASVETAIQAAISSLDEGWGRRILRAFIFAVVAVGTFVLYARSQFRGLRDPEAMEYAQVARNLAAGRGFVTGCVRPSDAWFLAEHGRPVRLDAFPDVRHGPVYPALLAAGFRLAAPSFSVAPSGAPFSPELRVVLPMCGTFSLLTGVLIFLTGRRLFDGRVALVAAAAYVLCDSVLGQAAGGGPLSVGAFFVTASFWAAVVAAEAGRRLLAGLPLLALSGALCGAAFLTGYGAVAALPAVVVFAAAAFEDRRWTAGAIVCLAFAAVVAPWIARNLRCSGAPLGIAPHAMFVRCGLVSEDALDQTLSRLDGIRAAAVVRRHFLAELSGVFEGGPRQWGGGLVAALFFVSFFRAFGSGTAGRFRWSALLGIGLLGAGAAGGLARPVELALLLPVVMLVGSAFFFDLVEGGVPSDPGRSALLTGVFLLLAAAGTIARLAGPAARTPYPPYYPPLAAYVCGLLEPAEALCTDIPWATAWYGGRVSVLLPRSVDDVERLSKLGMPVGGVYLTTETGDRHHASELVAGQYRSWLPVLDRRVPAGFPFVHGIALPPGTRDQLFLTDRDRWGTGGNTVPPAGAAPPGTGEKPGPTSPAPPAAEPRVPIREPAARP